MGSGNPVLKDGVTALLQWALALFHAGSVSSYAAMS